jgi:hypothetical protein
MGGFEHDAHREGSRNWLDASIDSITEWYQRQHADGLSFASLSRYESLTALASNDAAAPESSVARA